MVLKTSDTDKQNKYENRKYCLHSVTLTHTCHAHTLMNQSKIYHRFKVKTQNYKTFENITG